MESATSSLKLVTVIPCRLG